MRLKAPRRSTAIAVAVFVVALATYIVVRPAPRASLPYVPVVPAQTTVARRPVTTTAAETPSTRPATSTTSTRPETTSALPSTSTSTSTSEPAVGATDFTTTTTTPPTSQLGSATTIAPFPSST